MIATAALALLAVVPDAASADVELLACGATVPANERAVLRNDVECQFRCSGDPAVLCSYSDDEPCRGLGRCEADVFRLARNSVLDLDGHTILAAYQAPAVVCGSSNDDGGRCIVKGPGLIQGGKGSAIYGTGMDVVVRDVTVSRFDVAIYTLGRLVAKGLVVLNDRENGIIAEGGVILRDVVMDGEWKISSGRDMVLDGVVLGPHNGRLEAVRAVRGRDVSVLGRRSIVARDIALRRVTAEPDAFDIPSSISAERRLRLVDSDVMTIESGKRPVLIRTTCDDSVVAGSLDTWAFVRTTRREATDATARPVTRARLKGLRTAADRRPESAEHHTPPPPRPDRRRTDVRRARDHRQQDGSHRQDHVRQRRLPARLGIR
jgi:hypothetical protein